MLSQPRAASSREWLEQYCCSLGTLSARKECRQVLVYSYTTVMTDGSLFVCVCCGRAYVEVRGLTLAVFILLSETGSLTETEAH